MVTSTSTRTDLQASVADLRQWMAGHLTFDQLPAPHVTARITAEVLAWGKHHGWMAETEVPSAAMRATSEEHQAHQGYLDVVLDRWGRPSVVVEIDRGNKSWSLRKLQAEARRGRTCIWVRWGRERPSVPQAVGLVYLPVVMHSGAPRRYSLASRPPAAAGLTGRAGNVEHWPSADAQMTRK